LEILIQRWTEAQRSKRPACPVGQARRPQAVCTSGVLSVTLQLLRCCICRPGHWTRHQSGRDHTTHATACQERRKGRCRLTCSHIGGQINKLRLDVLYLDCRSRLSGWSASVLAALTNRYL
jgi:hypothetical protein